MKRNTTTETEAGLALAAVQRLLDAADSSPEQLQVELLLVPAIDLRPLLHAALLQLVETAADWQAAEAAMERLAQQSTERAGLLGRTATVVFADAELLALAEQLPPHTHLTDLAPNALRAAIAKVHRAADDVVHTSRAARRARPARIQVENDHPTLGRRLDVLA